MRQNILLIIIIAGILLVGCLPEPAPLPTNTPQPPTPIPSPTPGMSPEALAFVNEVAEIIQRHALNREMINFDFISVSVYAFEYDAVTSEDTYDSISFLVGQLRDKHSRFLTPEEAEWFRNLDTSDVENPSPLGEIREDKFAYLHIPQFASGDLQVNQKYANDLFDLVMDVDAKSPCGWVIDLRDNYGGNIMPMVSGLIPLIRDGIIGGFQDVDGKLTPIEFSAGEFIGEDENDWFDTGHQEIGLHQPNAPIAILIGPMTASSGEMLALTFKGLENVVYFGHQTAGMTTGNDKFDLSDGSILLLTTSVFVDREGSVYGSGFEPDFPLESMCADQGEIPPEVIEWLNTRESCQAGQ